MRSCGTGVSIAGGKRIRLVAGGGGGVEGKTHFLPGYHPPLWRDFARRAAEPDFANRITDAVEDALSLVQIWEEAGVGCFRPMAAQFFYLGALVYEKHQSHFLAEYLFGPFGTGRCCLRSAPRYELDTHSRGIDGARPFRDQELRFRSSCHSAGHPAPRNTQTTAGRGGKDSKTARLREIGPDPNCPMLLTIPDVLSPDQVAETRKILDKAEWVDGKVTAGHQSARAKDNLQIPEGHPAARQIGGMILSALGNSPLFISAALPAAYLSAALQPLFGRPIFRDACG